MARARKASLVSKLDQVIEYIDEIGTPSIIEAIVADHADLRKFAQVMKSDKAPKTKKAAYKSFSELLKSHASAEEKAVYAKCLRIKSMKIEAHEGYVEHALAARLMKEIDSMRTLNAEWEAKVKVLAEIVEHHAAEEERELLPHLHDHVATEKRSEMREEFVDLRIRTQRNHGADNAGVLNANI